MKLLPRYTFRGGELCPHGDPDCLCDITVTETIPINKNIPHMFHQLALKELGEHGVTSRNVVEFFSVVLGCYDIFRREVAPQLEDTNSLRSNVPPAGKENAGPEVWRMLPDATKTVLRRHSLAGTPWSYAILELEDVTVPADSLGALRKYYNDSRRNAFHSDKRRSVVRVQDCAACGAPFAARSANALFCSNKCKMVEYRNKQKGV